MKITYPIILFAVNLVIMSLELVGIRILAPFFGTSSIVWTSMISTIFCSLTFGYFLGGYISEKFEKNQQKALQATLFFSSISLAIIAITKDHLLYFSSSLTENNELNAIIASSSLFLIPSTLLSIAPVIIGKIMLTKTKKNGSKLSQIFAISSLGGVAGLWLTTFIFIPHIGSNKILFFLSSIVIISFTILISKYSFKGLSILFGIYMLTVSFKKAEHNYIDKDSLYNRILVYEDNFEGKKLKIMQLNNRINAAIDVANPYKPYYGYNIKILDLVKNKEQKQNILILGGAALTLSNSIAQLTDVNTIDVLEIDKQLTHLANTHFFKTNNKINVINTEARSYLNKVDTSKKYDVIIWDVFTSENNIPDHLTTKQTAKILNRITNSDGDLYMNILSPLDYEKGGFLYSEIKTFRSIFTNNDIHPVSSITDSNITQNIILQFNNKANTPLRKKITQRGIIITDDYCPFSYK